MEYFDLIKKRYSVRDFKNSPVEDEKISAILKAAQLAPTAKNTQCQKIYVLKSKSALEKIRSVTPCAFNAPLVFITCANLDKQCFLHFNPEHSLKETDVAIVQTQMMLAAEDLGLGTCWVCYFDADKLKKTFGLPENVEPLNMLVAGYPSENAKPSERHGMRAPYTEYTEFL